ncbi:SH3 domain-containing protein [Litoreibacter arenae]|uniref:SH3b domain-containing protein n=1 Tax=Litoreibacter arenae DSM 19593 TaxID=1123360 RepID=S9RFP2_9RHOB|nr:SH3 domain-containing protein [Litoreibacter arenae]EPX76920.1 hypothetical protein thalar_02639 [Litoreibacter arenae DSM 19593]
MFKWVVGLCAGLYLILLTMGEPSPEELAARESRAERHVTRSASVVSDAPVVAEVEEPEVVAAPAVVETIESPVLVSATTDTTPPAAPEPVAAQTIAAPAPAATDIRRVTGRRVNLRAGPSTTTAILGRAVRDDTAEVIELLPSGWAKVYILDTGLEAYISAQFLSDAG